MRTKREAMHFMHIGLCEYFVDIGAAAGVPRIERVLVLEQCARLAILMNFVVSDLPAFQLGFRTPIRKDLARKMVAAASGDR